MAPVLLIYIMMLVGAHSIALRLGQLIRPDDGSTPRSVQRTLIASGLSALGILILTGAAAVPLTNLAGTDGNPILAGILAYGLWAVSFLLCSVVLWYFWFAHRRTTLIAFAPVAFLWSGAMYFLTRLTVFSLSALIMGDGDRF
ncbi:MAG: hypothetical protein ACIAQF_10265 [Phycisphaerales bacterium JB065]